MTDWFVALVHAPLFVLIGLVSFFNFGFLYLCLVIALCALYNIARSNSDPEQWGFV